MQTVKKGGRVLGKRPSHPSRQDRTTASPPHPAPASNSSVGIKRRQSADGRDRAETKGETKEDEEDAESDEGGADGKAANGDDSSSDSDNADITIDINAKHRSHTTASSKKHKPNTNNTTHNNSTPPSTASTTQSPLTDTELINVEFGLFDPQPDDDFTFRLLLKDYVPANVRLPVRPTSTGGSSESGAVFALNELCALISGQVEVGTTIKADGTDEPLGLITALPLPPLLNAPLPLNQLHAYLSSHVPAAYKARLNALFSSSSRNVLLVQSRLLNTPTALVGPLHSALVGDIQWAASHHSTTQHANPWHVDRVLLLGRCVKAGGGVSGGRRGGGGGLDVWVRFEEEWYERESEWSCRWPVPYRSRGDEGGDSRASEADERLEGQTAVLMCLTWEKLKLVVEHIQLRMKDA